MSGTAEARAELRQREQQVWADKEQIGRDLRAADAARQAVSEAKGDRAKPTAREQLTS